VQLNSSLKNALFRYNLGNTYLLEHNLLQAIEQLKKAIELRHDYPEAHNDLGNAYLDSGDYINALSSFAQTIQLSQYFTPGYNSLGVAYYGLRRFAEARTQFIKGLALAPHSFQLQYNLGSTSLYLNDYSNAIRCRSLYVLRLMMRERFITSELLTSD
jgi:protein O-GlcNAc transferase